MGHGIRTHDLWSVTDGQTDRQTDGRTLINCVDLTNYVEVRDYWSAQRESHCHTPRSRCFQCSVEVDTVVQPVCSIVKNGSNICEKVCKYDQNIPSATSCL